MVQVEPATSGATFADVCGASTGHTVRVRKMKAGENIYVYNLKGARVGAPENADLPADSTCRFHWRAEKDTTYYIQINNVGDATSNHELIVDQDTGAPAQPTIDGTWPGTTGPSHWAKFTGGPEVTFVCALDSVRVPSLRQPAQPGRDDRRLPHVPRPPMDAHGNLSPIVSRYWKVETPEPASTEPIDGDPPAKPARATADAPVQESGEPTGPATGVVTAVSPRRRSPAPAASR